MAYDPFPLVGHILKNDTRCKDPWTVLFERETGDPITRDEVIELLNSGAPPPPEAMKFIADVMSGKKGWEDTRGTRHNYNRRLGAVVLATLLQVSLAHREKPERHWWLQGKSPRQAAEDMAGLLYGVSGRIIRTWRKEMKSYGWPDAEVVAGLFEGMDPSPGGGPELAENWLRMFERWGYLTEED